tara:strand:+ start:58 stop:201 length:144 start_codon:yes stop_codon:yes gene_type:complete
VVVKLSQAQLSNLESKISVLAGIFLAEWVWIADRFATILVMSVGCAG